MIDKQITIIDNIENSLNIVRMYKAMEYFTNRVNNILNTIDIIEEEIECWNIKNNSMEEKERELVKYNEDLTSNNYYLQKSREAYNRMIMNILN